MSSSEISLTNDQMVYELESALHSFILDVLGYGIYTGVYFVALYLTLSRETERPRVGSAVLITVMWILVAIHIGLTWDYTGNVFIRHGTTREAQMMSLLPAKPDESFPQRIINTVATFAGLLLADMTMIWRCWALYARRSIICVIPGLFLLAGSVSYIWRTILIFRPRNFVVTNQVNNLELGFLSATVLTNIFCTTAIIYRIVSFSGWRKSLKTYHGLMEILIESSLLYTSIYIIRIGQQTYAQYFTEELDERFFFAQALGYSITGLVPTLVIARVAAGFTRPDDSCTSLPHMRSTMPVGSLQHGRSADLEQSTGRISVVHASNVNGT